MEIGTFLIDIFFFIRIFGTTPSSFTPFIPYRTELVGTEIQIEGCISGSGFAVPGFYWRSIPVTGLPPENYTVSVYRAICRDFKEPVVPWTFAGSTTFSVSDANANLPNDGTRIPPPQSDALPPPRGALFAAISLTGPPLSLV